MSQTLTITKSEYKQLLNRIASLESSVTRMANYIFKKKSQYGTDKWWLEEIIEAKKELKTGKGILLNEPHEIDEYLDRLEQST